MTASQLVTMHNDLAHILADLLKGHLETDGVPRVKLAVDDDTNGVYIMGDAATGMQALELIYCDERYVADSFDGTGDGWQVYFKPKS